MNEADLEWWYGAAVRTRAERLNDMLLAAVFAATNDKEFKDSVLLELNRDLVAGVVEPATRSEPQLTTEQQLSHIEELRAKLKR